MVRNPVAPLRRSLAGLFSMLFVAAVVLVSGCSTEGWRHLELGDVLSVRGRQLLAVGGETLIGGVSWTVGFSFPPRLAVHEVRRARFGVGTAARWTLQGDATDAVTWPAELDVARAVWHVEIFANDAVTRHRFDLPAGQRLVRALPCGTSQCSYEFSDTDAHRDVFTFEAVAGRDATMDEWLDGLDRGLRGTVWLTLDVEVRFLEGTAPDQVVVMVPMAPSGASLEFRP